MSASIVPAALTLISEFNETYGTCTIIEKIWAVIEKSAKTV